MFKFLKKEEVEHKWKFRFVQMTRNHKYIEDWFVCEDCGEIKRVKK